MKKRPFFSIIIPTYNRAKDLQFALYCLFRQSFSDFEIVISDNCSTDDTELVVRSMNSEKITYLKNKKNITYSLNAKNAMENAKGEYIFLHSDDDFLFDKDALKKIYLKVKLYKPGYIRIGYVCISPDRRKIFNFRVNNSFHRDEYLSQGSSGNALISFILNTDHYFITGTIFKNDLPKNITILTTEHAPWMEILIYITKKYGALFIAEPYIAASWSTWRNKKDGAHPVYSLINGKLEAENYFNVVKNELTKEEYNKFLYIQLMGIYVRLFPLIKVLVGNRNLLIFTSRIRSLNPEISKSVIYWLYLVLALLLPKDLIKTIKNLYLYSYIRLSGVKNEIDIIDQIRKIQTEYILKTGNNVPIFKF